ncbi:MAG TPA: sigma-70 family RNA polymerase sigma factor [Burkholderiales bacterium]|nr:sigma-70 family RNA polymerase sigma factor [Burkholderiales bacterium]
MPRLTGSGQLSGQGGRVQSEPTDDECVTRSRHGDRNAFGTLVRRYQDRLYRFILRMVGSRDEALELTQDAFMKAWQALPEWRPEAAFRTWLFSIASNAATDSLRRRKAVEFVPLDEDYDVPGEAADPAGQLQAKQRLRALDAALSRLPDDQREIVLLREIEDMSYSEISAALAISEGTVKSRLARAREALVRHYRRKDV